MKYEDLLEKDEWEVKRYEILARDNYTCQDCGCRGINNDIFFPISSISDLDILLPDWHPESPEWRSCLPVISVR